MEDGVASEESFFEPCWSTVVVKARPARRHEARERRRFPPAVQRGDREVDRHPTHDEEEIEAEGSCWEEGGVKKTMQEAAPRVVRAPAKPVVPPRRHTPGSPHGGGTTSFFEATRRTVIVIYSVNKDEAQQQGEEAKRRRSGANKKTSSQVASSKQNKLCKAPSFFRPRSLSCLRMKAGSEIWGFSLGHTVSAFVRSSLVIHVGVMLVQEYSIYCIVRRLSHISVAVLDSFGIFARTHTHNKQPTTRKLVKKRPDHS